VSVLTVEMSTTSGPKTTNAQQGTLVKNVEYVLIYRKSSSFDTHVSHTPLYDGIEKWDANYPLWLNDDGTTELVYDRLDEEPDVRADIERFELVSKSGKRKGTFIGASGMDLLLAASEPARAFILDNLHRIGRTDTPPVSGKSVDVPVGRWVEHRTDDRTYRLTRSAQGKVWQIYTLDRNYRMSDDYAPRFGRTVIRGDLWRGFHSDMGHVSNEGGIGFANGKKPIRLIQQLIRWANNDPDTVIVDFFAGSGSTAHAVMAMNQADGGQRQAILITNNEVGIDAAKAMRNKGLHPGDPTWESQGVFRAVTQPRIKHVIAGGASANVEFFNLTYLDPGRVRRGHEYESVAPLMWLEAGAVGARLDALPESGWAVTEAYGVLFAVDALPAFADAIAKSAAQDRAPRIVFVITDSPTEYQQVCERLPVGVETIRLYQDYLSNYTINVEGGAR
jgi:adenine-specific DNA-methyltransferase